MLHCKQKVTVFAALLLFSAATVSKAAEPAIQTQGPVIYLADNLNEEARLGWCIDTKGRGFSDKLHAHSCKPGGGDTQFAFDENTGAIQSVEFAGKCMALNNPENPAIPFGLIDCDPDNLTQQFTYDADSAEFRIGTDESKCVAVAETISNAGPFQSRDLVVADCVELSPVFKQWVIRK